MPIPVIALVCTAVSLESFFMVVSTLINDQIANCLDKCATGEHERKPFVADSYRKIYNRHIAQLTDFKKQKEPRYAKLQRSSTITEGKHIPTFVSFDGTD